MDIGFKKLLSAFRLVVLFQLLFTSFYVKSIETCESIFVASSGVSTISTADAELLNFISGGLLGLNAKLSLADTEYSSLLAADIELESYLDTLAIDLSVANKTDAVSAQISLTQAIDAAITVLQNQGGNALTIATLNAIKVDVPVGTFSLLDVIALNVEDSAILSTSVNVLDFHLLMLQAFNHQNAISAQNISLNLNTLGLDGSFGPLSIALSDISAAVIAVEGPKLVSGPVGSSFTTSSIRLRIIADLIDVAAAPLTLGLATVTVTLTDFEMYADVARANGTVEQLSYLTQTLRLNVTPGVASLYLGQMNTTNFNDRTLTSEIDYASEVTPVVIGSINIDDGATSETVALEARANATANGSLESLDFIEPYPTSQTTTAGVSIVNTLLSTLLTNTALTTTPDPVLVDKTLLLDLIRPLVVDDILSPVIGDIVTNLADPTVSALGVSIGNATEKVFAINGDSCIPTVNSLNTANPTPILSGLAYRSVAGSELLNIELNNITYQENIDFTVTDNQWTLTVPPADTLTDGVYSVIATVTNGVESVADQSIAELTVDTVQPTVQIQNVPANSSAPFTATFTFNEPVTDFILADISVANASSSAFTPIDSSTYTALITPTADGSVTIDVNANVAQDSAGNLNTAATQVSSIFDGSRPSISISNVPANVNSAFTATFTFSTTVTGFLLADISVANASVSNFSAINGSTYTALITPTAEGTVTLDVNANVAQDGLGNLNTAAAQVSSLYDVSFPSITIQNVPTISNIAFTATFAFSEAVTGFTAGDITLTNAVASNFTTVNSSTYTALITPSVDGAVTVDVNANVAQDNAGNSNLAATQVSNQYDTSLPSVAIQNVLALNTAPFTATFAFSEVVTGFDVGDITLTNAAASNFTSVNSSTYTALITPVTDGIVTLNVNANVAQDSAGNLNTAATQISSNYVDGLPFVTIENVPANANSAFTATFAFSEAVTGFEVSDITLTNAAASNFTAVSSSIYTALITPTVDGVVTLNVAPNVALDNLGNLNIAAVPVISQYDTSRPSVAIQNVLAQTATAFTATFAFSEAVTGFDVSDITLANAAVSNFTTLTSSTYTALITPASDGTVSLNVNENIAQDIAGNLNTAAAQVTSQYDAIFPSIAIQNVPANSNSAFTATFAFSEAVTGFVQGDITLTNAVASNFSAVNASTYTALITPTVDGVVTLNVGLNVAQDSVGNPNLAATPVISEYDTSRPSVAILNVLGQSAAPFLATFAFSEDVTGFIAGDISVVNGSVSNFTPINSSTYTALISPVTDGAVTIDVIANVAQDSAGNLNTAATQVISQYDVSLLSVAIQNVPANSNSAFTATFAFSEAVTGFEVSDITLTNAVASNFTAVSSSIYTALITPTTDGLLTLNIGPNVAQNGGGNLNIAAAPVVSLFDTSRPSVDIQNVLAQTATPFTATFAFSEAVTGFDVSDITLVNAVASNFTTVSSSTYTALITPTSDGTVTLNVNENIAQDIAGNLNTAATQVTTQYDALLPSVAIQNVPANSSSAFTATFAFSEAVTGFVLGDITLTNAAASNFTAVNSSTYTALITPTVDGLVTLNVGLNVAQDSVGNPNLAATPVISQYDTSRPSVAILNVLAQSAAPFIATFAFSEAVTGFISDDISAVNASVSNFTPINSSTYTALITPITGGAVTLDVIANVAQDNAGNLNTAATQVISQYNVNLLSVAIQNVPANSSSAFTATFAFSDAVTGFVVGDITLTNAVASNFTTVSGSTYTALITPSADGLVTLNIAPNVAQNSVGIPNIAAAPVVSLFDTSRPSVTIQNVFAQTATPFTATFAFSEAVTGFVVGDITLANATASNFTALSSSTYTALITPILNGTVTLNVNANVAQDSAGNTNTAAVQVSTQYNALLPSVAIQNVPASSNSAFTATFAFSEAVTGFVLGDITLTNAVASNFTTINSSTYTALITPAVEGLVTLNVGLNVAQDSMGNPNIAAIPVISQYDISRPSIAILNVLAQTTAPFTATFAFSEAVTGFIVDDINVANGSVSNLIPINTSTYTALITPTTDGIVTIDVIADVVQDLAGNLNTAATQVISQYDASSPSVSIQNVPDSTNSSFTATISFSEIVIGFELSDINVTNASVSNFTIVDGRNFTALITPAAGGVFTVNVNANVAQDIEGNLNTAATQVSGTYDIVQPSVVIQNVPTNSFNAFTVTFDFSEPVTEFILNDISLTNATASDFTTVNSSSYTALITPLTSGLVTLGVNANVAQDNAGNLNTAASQVTSEYDASRPSVAIQNIPAASNSAFSASFVFSKPVSDFIVSDITVTNASVSDFAVIDSSNYSALITPAAEGEITLDVNENVATDSLGNFNTAAAQATSQYDISPPIVTIVNGPAINIDNELNYLIEGTCNADDNAVLVTVNTSVPTSVACDEGFWSLNQDMSAIADGEAVVTINAQQTDNASNIGNAEPAVISKDTETPTFSLDTVIYNADDALIFTGTSDSEDGTIISIIDSNNNVLCTALVENNVWTCESDVVLAEGSYDLRAEASDNAGNISTIFFTQVVNYDEDNDGISNSVEGYGDSDNDGIPDAQDTDSDNDGIPDSEEGVGDDDRDNIPNYLDTSLDEDSDGVPDIIEGNTDVDNDGIINALDADSDNDGIVDGFEAQISGNDSDQDGIDDIFDADLGGDDPDGDGITYQAIDTDNDGIADLLDIDSDGDRIPEALEAFIGFKDIDNDGIWDRYNQSQTGGLDIDNDGIDDLYDADQTNGFDADNDGINDLLLIFNDHNLNFIPDHLEIDSDDDGIHDSVEAQVTGLDHDDDGIDDSFDADLSNVLDDNGDGIIDTFVFIDTDADGVIDMNDLDSDNDGDTDVFEANVQDDDNNGIANVEAPVLTEVIDTDADNIPDYLDLDRDNDGNFDIQDNAYFGFDLNNDGQVDTTLDIDGDGIDDSIDGDNQVLGHGDNADSDNDSILDAIDKDDDNDGIADVTEQAFQGTVNAVNSFFITNSINTRRNLNNETRRVVDSDNDGIVDEKDRDSDNDGISDLIENGRPNLSGFDHDKDGIDDVFDVDFTGGVDEDEDGVDDTYLVIDTDQDSVPDYLDLDSDNDSISDNIEQLSVAPSGLDINGNGIDDAFDPAFNNNQDDNLDGIDDVLIDLSNPDGDNILHFQDTDSDGDNILDAIEGANDFDGDGSFNFLDLDSDGDEIRDAIEGETDFDVDGASNFLDLDSDGDGISDLEEGDIDTDNDGTPNFLDLDSDNDGILDQDENGDFDGDGVNDSKQDQRKVQSNLIGSGNIESYVVLWLVLLCLIRNRQFKVAVKNR